MIIHNCEQGTPEWIKLRLGIPTASMFSKILTAKTAKLSEQSDAYLHLLLAEWISGQPVEDFENDWTRHGHEYEAEARAAYEVYANAEVTQVGFITTDDGLVGASPDGLVCDAGAVELKCPKANNHVGYMLSKSMEDKYRPQLQGQLWVCQREYVDIQSYCPGYPTVVFRVERDEEYIGKLEKAIGEFVERMMEAREKLESKYGPFTRRVVEVVEEDHLGITDEDLDAILQARNNGTE